MDDTISRKDAIDDILDYMSVELKRKIFLAMLKGEPMNDSINRQMEDTANIISLLSDIRSRYNLFDPDEAEYYHALSEAIRALRAERKKGEWIRNDNGTYSCSACQSWIPEEQHYYARYCLYCGADMREEGQE